MAVPILEFLGEHAGLKMEIPVWHIADETGIDPDNVGFELENLIAACFVIGPINPIKKTDGGDPSSWFLESNELETHPEELTEPPDDTPAA